MSEARVIVADKELSYAESLTLRVAVLHFLAWLQDNDTQALGEPLRSNYERHARNLTTLLTLAANLQGTSITSIPEPP